MFYRYLISFTFALLVLFLVKEYFLQFSADYNFQLNPIPGPHPDNKALHQSYKLHIVHDHEQIQSEMTDHNKDKPFLADLYQYSVDLIG